LIILQKIQAALVDAIFISSFCTGRNVKEREVEVGTAHSRGNGGVQ